MEKTFLRPVAKNAFRVLGLPADASQRSVLERAAAMDRAAKVGMIRPPSPWDLKWFGPLEQERSSISDALGRLGNPQQRLTERLFWFAQSDRFVEDISSETLDSTIATLQASLFPDDHHDAAVLALASCFSADTAVHDAERWHEMLQMWTALVESEDFWNGFIDIERSGDFVPAGSSEDLERLRSQSLPLVINSLAEIARDAASRAEFDLCQRALETIRTSSFPAEILSATEESVLSLYEDALVRTSKEITKRCWEDIRQDRASAELNAKPCSVAVDRWKQELESKYRNLVAMSGTRTKFGLRARQHYADFLISLGNALTWANQWTEAEEVLRQARSCLPSDSPARKRIEALLPSIGDAATEERESDRKRRKQTDIEGFEHLCKGIWIDLIVNSSVLSDTIDRCNQADRQYDERVLPRLSIICASESETSLNVLRAKTAAARCLFTIAEGFRHCGNYSRASELIAAAAELAPQGSEIAQQIDARCRTAQEGVSVKRGRSKQEAPILHPQDLTDLATIGAELLLQGVTRFPDWAARMMQDEGELVRSASDLANQTREAALREIYEYAVEVARPFETGAATAGNTSSDERMAQGTGSIPANIAEPEPESSPSGNAFVELCHSIKLQCWQQIKPGHFDANLLVFRAAHADYKRRAAPWLATVLESLDRGSTRVVRHAAAKCMNSLAVGFISVGDLGTARTIALEALPLIADIDRDLESEIRRQLDYIASQMTQSAPKRGATHRSDNQVPRPVGANNEEPVTFRTPSFAKWLKLGVVAAVLLLAVFTAYIFSGSPKQPSIAGVGTQNIEPTEQIGAQQRPQVAMAPPVVLQAVPLHSPTEKPFRTQLDPVVEAPTHDPDSRREPTPTAPLPDPVSLPNGTNLIPPPDGESAGTFTIENSSSSEDSVVILKDAVSNKYLFAVYVGAKSTFTVPKIPSGKYLLEWAYGRDWDATHRSFRRTRGFGKSQDPFVFPDDRIRHHTVTLHTVAGNTRIEAISAEEFASDLGAAVVINNKR